MRAESGTGTAKRPPQPRARRAVSQSVPAGGKPSRPARSERERTRFGILVPEVLTVRILVLSVVVLLAVVLLLPTVRAVVGQQAELAELRQELAAQQQEKAQLDNELSRWDDRSYVIEQARTRLRFIMPGDTAWRTLDGDTVPESEPEPGPVQTARPGEDEDVPWFTRLWESLRLADQQ
ncbi:septum formation initiator family protein [Myceligenerans crystallogenes]|uniref:Cell division protein FtsB n=1 Tax=Myceligenerans crystallogenes TaxID=316335 RepID=A0ABN2NCD6_9MICO